MINLTKSLIFIKTNDDLYRAIVTSIKDTVDAIEQHFNDGRYIDPELITSGRNNPFKRAGIKLVLADYESRLNSDLFNKEWVCNVFKYVSEGVNADVLKAICTPSAPIEKVTTKTMLKLHKLGFESLIHFLWSNGAILLPLNMKLPYTKRDDVEGRKGGNNLEWNASSYPELLAIVRKPFEPSVSDKYDDISTSLKSKENFNAYAWRIVRATDWYSIEDIKLSDIEEYLLNGHKPNGNIFNYPFSPVNLIHALLLSSYSERCPINYEDIPKITNRRKTVTRNAVKAGAFVVDPTIQEVTEQWYELESDFIKTLEAKGYKNLFLVSWKKTWKV